MLYLVPEKLICLVAVLPILSAPAAITPPLPALALEPISLMLITPADVSLVWALIVKLASGVVAPISPVTVIIPVPDERIRFFSPSTVEPRLIDPLPALVSIVEF